MLGELICTLLQFVAFPQEFSQLSSLSLDEARMRRGSDDR
jgi:hypothetical protein